ncbi:MAG: metalloregulator ArsR/SmtB family transcription factor [Clostridia bacterium]|nr:metalloregulator ArsR/SmtB family transcription factor [Clostridia bacterium]
MTSNSSHKDSCSCNVIHQDRVDRVKSKMPNEEKLYDLADLFKVFGDTTRIKIICALFEAEMCVCDIAVTLGMSQSAISHQLRVLKSARLVKYRRDGKIVYYSLDDEHVKNIFDQGFSHISHI